MQLLSNIPSFPFSSDLSLIFSLALSLTYPFSLCLSHTYSHSLLVGSTSFCVHVSFSLFLSSISLSFSPSIFWYISLCLSFCYIQDILFNQSLSLISLSLLHTHTLSLSHTRTHTIALIYLFSFFRSIGAYHWALLFSIFSSFFNLLNACDRWINRSCHAYLSI